MKLLNNLALARVATANYLLNTGTISAVGEWHSQKASSEFIEAFNWVFKAPIPDTIDELQNQTQTNLPWAEEHFQERIGGEPLNPPPSHERWPFATHNNDSHISQGLFSHTYPERFWPKNLSGMRFNYGGLDSIINRFINNPYSRQLYLSIWWPEDQGCPINVRVPCSLGYHFTYRSGYLHCTYTLRSCDIMRHYDDDIYMAARLVQHMVQRLRQEAFTIKPGFLITHIYNLHSWAHEVPAIKKKFL